MESTTRMGSAPAGDAVSSANPAQYKRGGRVKRGGSAKLHKDEAVIRKEKRHGGRAGRR